MQNADFWAFLLSGLGLLGLVGLGEILRAKMAWRPESSRRIVHMLTGVFVVICPYIFTHPDWIFALAGTFIFVNFWAIRRRWFKGMHGIARRSWGTVTFPLALIVALWLCWRENPARIPIVQIAFLILAFADPLAAWVGTRVKNPRPFVIAGSSKSWAGSLAFGLAATVLAGLAGSFGLATDWGLSLPEWWLMAACLGLVLMGIEALGGLGWDNFFIVLGALLFLVVIREYPDLRIGVYTAVGVGVLFFWATYRVQFLDGSGALAAGLLAVSVLGFGGWSGDWAIPGFAFFILSSLLSKWRRSRKDDVDLRLEKSHRRDAGQVYANGGIAWILLGLMMFFPHPVWYWGFVGAFAAACADTWATEIGTGFKGSARLITTGRRVPAGTSGAVTGIGTLGALLGATVVSLSAWGIAPDRLGAIVPALSVLAASGVLASFGDSWLGATIQALYRTPDGSLTERATDAGQSHDLTRGVRWITNDRVNWANTVLGAGLAMAGYAFWIA